MKNINTGKHLQLEAEILITCALRFEGYDYYGDNGGDEENPPEELERFNKYAISGLFDHSLNYNLYAFFRIQRWLYKSSDPSLTEFCDLHMAFRMLFLHLYKEEIPKKYRFSEYCDKWDKEFKPEREKYAQVIRETFTRRGGNESEEQASYG